MTAARRVYISDRNVAPLATLSIPGGYPAVVAGRELPYMQTLPISETTRFDDTTIRFEAALDRAYRLTSWGFFGHNLSRDAERKITVAADAGFTDIQFTEDWTSIYEASEPSYLLDWEDPNWWDGKPLDEDLAIFTKQWSYVHLAGAVAGYLRCDLRDEANAELAIDVGYLWIGRGFQPTFSADLGAQLGFVEADLIDRAASGFAAVEDVPSPRTHTLRFSNLSKAEAMRMYDIGRRNGVSVPILVKRDPTDTANAFRTDFIARVTKRARPKQNEQDGKLLWSVDLEIEEILG